MSLAAHDPRPDAGLAALEAMYRELVRGQAERLWRLAYHLVGRRADADDLTQEAFLQAWRSLPSLRRPEAAGPWLTGILVRVTGKYWRTRARRPAIERPLLPGIDDRGPAPGPHRLETREEVDHALARLDPDRRLTLLLVAHEGMTCQAVAELLGVARGTVLSRLSRARDLLRRGEAGEAAPRRPHGDAS
jgi:RNA polymerase sigma-70 factor (ECF subfamily)